MKQDKRENIRMTVLTARCSQAFQVSPEQSEKFWGHKTDIKAKIETQGTLLKISNKLKNRQIKNF